MPPTFTIWPERRMVSLSYQGATSFSEWVVTMDSVLQDPRFHSGFAFLVDRRTAPAPTAEFVERVASYFARHRDKLGGEIRSATVVSDAVSYGMERMIEGFCGSTQMRVFRDFSEAESWLESMQNGSTAGTS